MQATYSPEDNKLRLYAETRLDSETYARVKAAGFIWAPKQQLFVAPMWTPYREDLLLELCDEIGDEDTSLVDRAEERADRFEDYRDSRRQDAEQARSAVDRIADGIPMGQPILIGHHSERHARKDAERIENGMRKAIKMWDTAQYWQQRAKGALRHAKYKELPAVRYRRIKGLEADKRKQEKYISESEMWLKLWTECAKEQDKDLQLKVALHIAGMCNLSMPRKEGDKEDFHQSPSAYGSLTNSYPSLYAPRTLEEVLEVALSPDTYLASIARHQRWLDHYTNRIAYEKAMLEESGGIKGALIDYEIGGRILRRGEWLPILKINKRDGVLMSVTVSGHFASTVSIDEIRDYRPPQPGEAEAVKAATDKGPMCNYPGEGCRNMTTDEWKRHKMSDVPQSMIHKATEKHGKHRTRSTAAPQWSTVAVYLTDSKRIDPPAPGGAPAPKLERIREPQPVYTPTPEPAAASDFDAMRESLKAGVQVITAPQLFPTPADLASRMASEAEIEEGHRILEPSAGTGNILAALPGNTVRWAVEINPKLASMTKLHQMAEVVCGDFLEQNGDLGKFDRVVMNPPFENGADIKHIRHALTFLKPGGRLVALCADGPRQREALQPIADSWESLPAGTFKEQGTNVNVALLTINV
jgi:protein-L-isoaspartate O-methyltransferase